MIFAVSKTYEKNALRGGIGVCVETPLIPVGCKRITAKMPKKYGTENLTFASVSMVTGTETRATADAGRRGTLGTRENKSNATTYHLPSPTPGLLRMLYF